MLELMFTLEISLDLLNLVSCWIWFRDFLRVCYVVDENSCTKLCESE
jgi:hypothetical protein